MQVSCRSHAPLGAPPQGVPTGCAASAGHVPLEPPHVSPTSHSPDDGRHVVPLARNTSTQLSALPLQ